MQINANSKINDIANNNQEYGGWAEVIEKNHSAKLAWGSTGKGAFHLTSFTLNFLK